MEIIPLKVPASFPQDNPKLNNAIHQFDNLLTLLKQRELSNKVTTTINNDIQALNSSTLTGKALVQLIRKVQTRIIRTLEKEMKIVPINYYRNLWLALGLSAFGLPIGVAIGLSLGKIGLLGVGLPFGMGIGLLLGAGMDKKAKDEGRQLDIEIK